MGDRDYCLEEIVFWISDGSAKFFSGTIIEVTNSELINDA